MITKIKNWALAVKRFYFMSKDAIFTFIAYLKADRSNPVYAATGYFPFVGWLIPLYLRENSELCQRSGKRGLLLSAYAALFLFAIFILELMIPSNLKLASFILIVLTYIFNLCYLSLSAYAMYKTFYQQDVSIPWLSQKADRIQI